MDEKKREIKNMLLSFFKLKNENGIYKSARTEFTAKGIDGIAYAIIRLFWKSK